jgi:Cu/Ag efflux protein CusF
MPPMTMVFGVSDAALLDRVKAGDKVRFRATSDGGKFTVTEIHPMK